jgi:beta-lactamase superfamily II metal-dependent hydrolase
MATKAQPPITTVDVRMYCLGTGDCFALKFRSDNKVRFTMLIDCGSCQGTPQQFRPYVENLAEWVKPNGVDLLVVTHEHNDHVNGFAKCRDLFEDMDIRLAWFAWTENPDDPSGRAQDLLDKRRRMRQGLANALAQTERNYADVESAQTTDYNNPAAFAAMAAFQSGLLTLAEINLNQEQDSGGATRLAGMKAIEEILKKKAVPIQYLSPGNSHSFPQLPGVAFHVLGPPLDRQYIYKEGKEGRDVYNRNYSFGEGILAMNALTKLGEPLTEEDLPFTSEYVLNPSDLFITGENSTLLNVKPSRQAISLIDDYQAPRNDWRTIEHEWLYTAGSLAIRLNSHINNTSLALAIEFGAGGKVMLLPGDAEYGSWESWHLIRKWEKAGRDGKSLVEDLLNRTVFYKVSHHLSYNGTALAKGIEMMNSPHLSTMVTLDRTRIASKWKTTMPNKKMLSELITRCQGRCFIMNEAEIDFPPSSTLNPDSLGPDVYHSYTQDNNIIYKQFAVDVQQEVPK